MSIEILIPKTVRNQSQYGELKRLLISQLFMLDYQLLDTPSKNQEFYGRAGQIVAEMLGGHIRVKAWTVSSQWEYNPHTETITLPIWADAQIKALLKGKTTNPARLQLALAWFLHEIIHSLYPDPSDELSVADRAALIDDLYSLPGWRLEEGITEAATIHFLPQFLRSLAVPSMPEQTYSQEYCSTYRYYRPLVVAARDLCRGLAELSGQDYAEILALLARQRPGPRWKIIAGLAAGQSNADLDKLERDLIRPSFYYRSATAGQLAVRRVFRHLGRPAFNFVVV